MKRSAVLALTLLAACSASEVKRTTHSGGVVASAAGGAALGAAVGGPGGAAIGGVLGGLAGEVALPTGSAEAASEAQAALLRALAEDGEVELPGQLGRLQKAGKHAEGLAAQAARAFDLLLIWGSLAVAAIAALSLWHYWHGSRRSNRLTKILEDEHAEG